MRHRPFPLLPALFTLLLVYLTSPNSAFSADAQSSPELKAMLNRIERLCQRNDYEAAIPIADAAVAKYPNDYEAHIMRGQVNLSLEEEDKAIADFQWALKRKPHDWAVLESISTAYSILGKQELALKYIDLSIASRTNKGSVADGWMKKKDILRRMKRNKDAEAAATVGLKIASIPHWHLDRMKLRVENENWPGVIEDANHIIALMPKHRERIVEARAKAYIGLKRYPEAERDLNELIKSAPGFAKYHQERLRLYKLQGKKDLAQKEEILIKSLGEGI